MKKIFASVLLCCLFLTSCGSKDIIAERFEQALDSDNVFSVSLPKDGMTEPFYGKSTGDIIAVGDGVIFHWFEITDLKQVQKEVDYRYNWYRTFNGTTDIKDLEYYGIEYGARYTKDHSRIYMPLNEFSYDEGHYSKLYEFDFSIPALSGNEEIPYFVYPWRADDSGEEHFYDLNTDPPIDGACSYIYGKVYIGDDYAISAFAYADTDDARSMVDAFWHDIGK